MSNRTPVYVFRPGTHVVRLTANDTDLSSSDDVTVTETGADNQPPIVELGPDQSANIGATIALDTDPHDDGLPAGGRLSTRWLTLNAPASPVYAPNGSGMNVTFPEQGIYTIKLIASDSALVISDRVRIFVGVTNAAPAVNAGTDKMSWELGVSSSLVGPNREHV